MASERNPWNFSEVAPEHGSSLPLCLLSFPSDTVVETPKFVASQGPNQSSSAAYSKGQGPVDGGDFQGGLPDLDFPRAHTKGGVQKRTLLRRVLRRVCETAFEKVPRRVLRRCLAVGFNGKKGSEKGS